MSFLIDDKSMEMIEYQRIVYSVFIDAKNVYPMWYSQNEDLFYFIVNIVKEGKKTMIAFSPKQWFRLKSHFEINSQDVAEKFIVSAFEKK